MVITHYASVHCQYVIYTPSLQWEIERHLIGTSVLSSKSAHRNVIFLLYTDIRSLERSDYSEVTMCISSIAPGDGSNHSEPDLHCNFILSVTLAVPCVHVLE